LAWIALGCGQPPASTPVQLVDLAGQTVNPLENDGATAKVFLFTRADCPISNRYAPEVQRLYEKFAARGVEFVLVYPNPDETNEGIRQHMRDYGYQCQALRDPHHQLVSLTGAEKTPEAAVFTPNGQMVYRGRIDDRYVDFGTARAQATTHDLEDTIAAVLDGRPITPRTTPAVGCYISDLK
jgi:hypothetical protein